MAERSLRRRLGVWCSDSGHFLHRDSDRTCQRKSVLDDPIWGASIEGVVSICLVVEAFDADFLKAVLALSDPISRLDCLEVPITHPPEEVVPASPDVAVGGEFQGPVVSFGVRNTA